MTAATPEPTNSATDRGADIAADTAPDIAPPPPPDIAGAQPPDVSPDPASPHPAAAAPGEAADDRKSLHGVDMKSDGVKAITADVYETLLAMTQEIAARQETYGLSVMCIGTQLWAIEMRALDRKGCGKYLRALADLMDPPDAKLRKRGRNEFLTGAEIRRRDGVQTMFDALKRRLSIYEGGGDG